MVVRVGFIGAAGIARKVWAAIHASGAQVTAVGCRDTNRGNEFVQSCCNELEISEERRPCVMTYDDVISSRDVDVVYIPIPVSQRDEWVRKAAANGKHVVGEKPPAINAEQLRQWLELFKAQDLFYMDGTMLSHGQRIYALAAAAQALGPIRHMNSVFTFNLENMRDIRYDPTLEPQGALGDLGWYCSRYMLHLMNWVMPLQVSALTTQANDRGAIVSLQATLIFPDAVSGSFFVSFSSGVDMHFRVSCAQGFLHVDDFCLPFEKSGSVEYNLSQNEVDVTGCKVTHRQTQKAVSVAGETSSTQEVNMWKEVQRLVLEKDDREGKEKWGRWSLATQTVIDAIHKSAAAGGAIVAL